MDRTVTEIKHERRLEELKKQNISFDYIPSTQTPDKKCRWICHECNPSRYFKSYPAFERHIKKKHR